MQQQAVPHPVGFWDPRRDRSLERIMPWDAHLENVLPSPNTAPAADAPLVDCMLRLQANGAHETAMFGSSWCRVCGAGNGSREYDLDGWTWPSGYAHYLRDHAVALPPDFAAFLAFKLRAESGSATQNATPTPPLLFPA
jgi:hypothetical protein